MTNPDFQELRSTAAARRNAVMRAKNVDYSGGIDVLANFKGAADQIGVTPLQVWGVYFWKHVCAVMAYARNEKVESEPITGRLDDCVNYLELLEGLIEDLEKGEACAS